MNEMVTWVFVLVFFFEWSYVEGQRVKRLESPRVIYGEKVEADSGTFPYIVSIYHYLDQGLWFICGGSILNPQIIISASHCFISSNAKKKTFIRPNYDNTIRQLEMDRYFRVKSFNCHPDTSQFIYHDICLLKLDEPIPFGHGIGPVELVTSQYPPGTNLTVSGFGKTEYLMKSNELRKAVIQRESDRVCEDKYPNFFYPKLMICFSGTHREDSCQGDSGGPLVDTTTSPHQLVGIVAWGAECGIGAPGVYTNVYHYRDWITNTIDSMMNDD